MNAFRNIDALLRVMAREKELIKFLFTGRKAPSLRPEQAMEHFLEGDERRLNLLLDHGVIRKTEEGGVLVLEGTERQAEIGGAPYSRKSNFRPEDHRLEMVIANHIW